MTLKRNYYTNFYGVSQNLAKPFLLAKLAKANWIWLIKSFFTFIHTKWLYSVSLLSDHSVTRHVTHNLGSTFYNSYY